MSLKYEPSPEPRRFKVQCRLVGFTLEMVSLDEARAMSLPKVSLQLPSFGENIGLVLT